MFFDRCRFVLILIASLFFLGMGELGTEVEPGKIPNPDKSFQAKVVDVDGIVTNCDMVSFNGKTVANGKRGNSYVTIPFDKIESIEVTKVLDKYVEARINLLTKTFIEIVIRKDVKCFGRTEFGTFYIYTEKISMVIFDHKSKSGSKTK